jgi:hypothetical protein
MERSVSDSYQQIAAQRKGSREPAFGYGDQVRHAGAIWTVTEDRGKNISIRNDKSFKTVLPEDVEALNQ